MNEIEDADIVVDLSGGKLAIKAYVKRIKDLQAQLDKVKHFLLVIAKHSDMCESCQEEAKMLLEEIE